jgi:Ca-activated chloride channel homolog
MRIESEMNPKQYELPTSESAELEPLAKALVALRRDETPIAPSAELRRLVEERLGELETNTRGAVITKEKAMLKNSKSRFRLRDWVFFAGGSVAAAVATTIIFWPAPRADVAKVAAPRYSNLDHWQESNGDATAVASLSRKNQEMARAHSETSVSDEWTEESMKSMMKMKDSIPGAGGMGAGGMSGMNPSRTAGPGGGGGYSTKYDEAHGLQPGDGELSTADGRNPYPPVALTINPSDPKSADDAPATDAATTHLELGSIGEQKAPKNDLMKSDGAVTGTGLTGRGEKLSREKIVAAYGGHVPSKEEVDRYRMSLAKEGRKGIEALARFSDEALPEATLRSALPLGEREQVGGEQYNTIVENQFLAPTSEPLSTFSIDVDTASYSNIRRFLTAGQLPSPAAVRIEEMVNYFGYSYAQPKGKEPFAVNMETAECPWNPGHVLLRVGLKGKEIARKARPASNLVFLLDVSGSMSDENKLPLLKTTMTMLIGELTENDRVTIVTYAGDAGLKLEPTSGDQKQKITDVIKSLSAGGSTNGSAGIELAYQKAAEAFIKEGTNRVILATDGDLNVGVTGDEALVKLIKEKAAGGTFLTVLGFGEGNLKDGKLEQIADNGNGMYAYIDSVREGRKMMVEQLSGSLVTIAKDVKIQIEFNPAQIQSYRLLGYENRVMAAADFNNDKKDAGEIGAGHTVTALYELVPVEASRKDQPLRPDVEPLKYQKTGPLTQTATPAEARDPKALTDAATSGELLTLKLRYKEPDGVESRLMEFPLKERGQQFNSASKDFQFAAAVASFGMILRGSQHRGSASASAIAEIAAGAIGEDPNGLRAEFVDLVRRAERLGIK